MKTVLLTSLLLSTFAALSTADTCKQVLSVGDGLFSEDGTAAAFVELRGTSCTKSLCLGMNANACTYYPSMSSVVKTGPIAGSSVTTSKSWSPINGQVTPMYFSKNYNYLLAQISVADSNGYYQEYFWKIVRPDGRTKSLGSTQQVNVVPTPNGKYFVISTKAAGFASPGAISLNVVKTCDLKSVLTTTLSDATWLGHEYVQFVNGNTLQVREWNSGSSTPRVWTWNFDADKGTTLSTSVDTKGAISCEGGGLSVSSTSSPLSRSGENVKAKGPDGRVGLFYDMDVSATYTMTILPCDPTYCYAGNTGTTTASKPFNCKTEPSRTAGAFITAPAEKCACGDTWAANTQYNVDCGYFATYSCNAGDTQVSSSSCGFFWAQKKFVCSKKNYNNLDSCVTAPLSSTAGFNESPESPPVDTPAEGGVDGGLVAQICIGVGAVAMVAVGAGIYMKKKVGGRSNFEGGVTMGKV